MMSENKNYVQDPKEKYQFLINPIDGTDERLWQECSQSDYYRFGQVVPVRILIPCGKMSQQIILSYPGTFSVIDDKYGFPIPLGHMKPVELFDEKEMENIYQRKRQLSPSLSKCEWETVWALAVQAVEAKLSQRLKQTLFVF